MSPSIFDKAKLPEYPDIDRPWEDLDDDIEEDLE